MLAIGETVSIEKAELRLLCAIASKDEDRPHINCVAIRCSRPSLRVTATDGHRVVKGECSLDDNRGCNVTIPLHVAQAALALCKSDGSITFHAHDLKASDCVVRWRDVAASPPALGELFALPLIDARRMPLFALDGKYLADAKLLSDAAGGSMAVTLHSPLDHQQPVHLICGAWHYVVMPMGTEETASTARQLCLSGMGVMSDASNAALQDLADAVQAGTVSVEVGGRTIGRKPKGKAKGKAKTKAALTEA